MVLTKCSMFSTPVYDYTVIAVRYMDTFHNDAEYLSRINIIHKNVAEIAGHHALGFNYVFVPDVSP